MECYTHALLLHNTFNSFVELNDPTIVHTSLDATADAYACLRITMFIALQEN